MKLVNLQGWVFRINVNVVVMISHSSHPGCYLWGKVGKGVEVSLYCFLQLLVNLQLSQNKKLVCLKMTQTNQSKRKSILKEVKPVNPKGNQACIFIGRTDAEAETPILWLPAAKN